VHILGDPSAHHSAATEASSEKREIGSYHALTKQKTTLIESFAAGAKQ
jgi:hypothetical protein